MTYLQLYKEWMEEGVMPSMGLCTSLTVENFDLLRTDAWELIKPTHNELMREYVNHLFWASGDDEPHYYEFTPLRQTIMLLCAAISGELD